MNRKLSQILLIIILVVTSSFSSFADDYNEFELKYLPQVVNTKTTVENDSMSMLRAANGIPITVTARQDGTGCDVYVGNIGADGLDSVTVTVEASGYSTKKTEKHYVPAILGKTFKFDFPMIKAKTIYDVDITIRDGGQVKFKDGEAKLEYTDTSLSGLWHKGTFSTRGASLEHHLDGHGNEVNSTNLVDYLNKAMSYRSEVNRDIADKDLSNYRVSTGTGRIPSKKYKNLTDKRFIILSNSTNEAFTFGK